MTTKVYIWLVGLIVSVGLVIQSVSMPEDGGPIFFLGIVVFLTTWYLSNRVGRK